MVILGGMGNTPGVIAAAILLTLLPEGLRNLSAHSLPLPFLPESWRSLLWVKDARMIIYSLLLILLMLTRPQGLFTFGAITRLVGDRLQRQVEIHWNNLCAVTYCINSIRRVNAGFGTEAKCWPA